MAVWVLDASHGGNDPGIIGGSLGKKESDIVLKAVLEAKKHLERNGETVVLTRDKDVDVTEEERKNIITHSKGDYLISFNMNWNVDNNITGVKISYLQKDEKNLMLANFIKDEILSGLKSEDLGVSSEFESIFKDTGIQGAIVYGDYLSNENIEKSFESEIFGMVVAKGCLAMVNKVLLLMPEREPKKRNKKMYLLCKGYYKDFNEAIDELNRLNNSGIKDVFLIPYEG